MDQNWSHRDDAAVLRRCRDTPQAFAVFYGRYERTVAAFLYRRTSDAELTADLTAETFLRAINQAEQFRGDGAAVGWLLAIAGNLHLGVLRRGKAELRACQRLGIGHIELGDESAERVAQYADASRLKAQLVEALSELPENQRTAVVAHVVGERSYAEVATALGLPEATVRKRVSRGLARLRTTINGGPA